MKKLLFFLLAFVMGSMANAQNVIPDSLFGTNSFLQVFTPYGEEGRNFLLQPDGQIIFGGFDYDISQNDFHIDMVRIDQCGRKDIAFGDSGWVRYKFDQRNVGQAFALQDDGKIIVAGLQAPSNAGSQQISFVSRFNSDGSPDSSFNLTGSNALRYDAISSGEFHAVKIMNDGRILCMGNCLGNINGGVNALGAMRFLSDGTPDPSFDSDGKVIFQVPGITLYSKAAGHLLSNGNIILTGYVYDGSFIEHFVAMQCDSNGVQDMNYGVNGFRIDTTLVVSGNRIVNSAVTADDKIILACNSNTGNSVEVIRLDSLGNLDTSFAVNGHLSISVPGILISGVQILSDTNILIRGSVNGSFGCAFMLDANGTLVSSFGNNGIRVFDLNNSSGGHYLDALLELPDGKWLAAGSGSDFMFKKYANNSNVPHLQLAGNSLMTTTGTFFQWYLDSNLIPFASNSSYQFTQTGNYQVEVTDSTGCTYMSDPFEILSVGINNNEAEAFQIYPNPAKAVLYIKAISRAGVKEIKIVDVLGNVVQQEKFNNRQEKYTVYLNGMQSGVYFVGVGGDDNEMWFKVLKK